MRNLLLLAGLSLSLAASVPYAKHPRKSCWLELTKEKGDQCFSAEPECSKSCKPGEPVSENYFLLFFFNQTPPDLPTSGLCRQSEQSVQAGGERRMQDRERH